jgi:hypothetical protein
MSVSYSIIHALDFDILNMMSGLRASLVVNEAWRAVKSDYRILEAFLFS